MPSIAKSKAVNALPQQADIRALSHVAHLANSLAKKLRGPKRADAYHIKDVALSALILYGAVKVNGTLTNAILGLDILTDPPSRIHIKLSDLQPEAQALIRKSVTSVPAKAPLFQLLSPDQLQAFHRIGNGREKDELVSVS